MWKVYVAAKLLWWDVGFACCETSSCVFPLACTVRINKFLWIREHFLGVLSKLCYSSRIVVVGLSTLR